MSTLRETIAGVVRRAGPMESQERLIDDLVSVLAAQPVQQPAPVAGVALPGCLADRLYEAISIARDRAQHAGSPQRMRKWDATRADLRAALTAPVAAPVDVPAASVQPDSAVVECMACDGHGARHYKDGEWRDKCPVCKGTGIAVGQVGELSDVQITDCPEAVELFGYMTPDEKTCDRLLLKFGRAILATAKKGPTT